LFIHLVDDLFERGMIRIMEIRRKTISILGFVSIFVLIFVSCGKEEKIETYFPETGDAAIHQRALDLESNLNVLSIALEPGFEDLSALSYFRMEKGANIISAYLTNGEAGENDIIGEYPNYLAASRRLEAADALYYLDGNIHFLNLPHVIAARDSHKVREKWIKSTVENKITELINQLKPDIILLARDWRTNNRSLRWQIFKDDVLSSIKKMALATANPDNKKNWTVFRLFVDDPEKLGTKLPVEKLHPFLKKSYTDLAEEAGLIYQSLSVQRKTWRDGKNEAYSILYPDKDVDVSGLDVDLPARNTSELQGINQKIKNLTNKIFDSHTSTLLSNLVAVLDSVNFRLATRFHLSDLDQRSLFYWKDKLEKLQCSLLGIKVKHRTDENVLTNVQLLRIYVDEVEGFEVDKNTTIYFSGLEQKWIVNEAKEKRIRLRLGDDYRIITPQELDYTTPQAKYGLQLARVDKPITIMIIHNAPTKEKSFIYRSDIRLEFAPKFSTEVLTPIVRMISGEKIIVRLTNHSRDGVRDTVRVVHEMAESIPGLFRLNEKEGTFLDSLTLIWNEYPEIGTYKLPIKIGEMEVANFAVRNFPVDVESAKKIGIVQGVKGSPLLLTMTRLGLKYEKIDPKINIDLDELDVLFIDRRVLTLYKEFIKQKDVLERFVREGGHLIFLAQNAMDWNMSGIWDDITLSDSQEFDENYPITVDKSHPFLNIPNNVEDGDWNEWLYQRAYHSIEVNPNSDISIPIQTEDKKSPLVLTKSVENGRMTYVNLTISPQLLNIHPGVFVLFANIISI